MREQHFRTVMPRFDKTDSSGTNELLVAVGEFDRLTFLELSSHGFTELSFNSFDEEYDPELNIKLAHGLSQIENGESTRVTDLDSFIADL